MRIRQKWYRNPRKRYIYPVIFIPWLILAGIFWFFELFGKIADLLELIIGSPLSRLQNWCENYEYDTYRKLHPDFGTVKIGRTPEETEDIYDQIFGEKD